MSFESVDGPALLLNRTPASRVDIAPRANCALNAREIICVVAQAGLEHLEFNSRKISCSSGKYTDASGGRNIDNC